MKFDSPDTTTDPIRAEALIAFRKSHRRKRVARRSAVALTLLSLGALIVTRFSDSAPDSSKLAKSAQEPEPETPKIEINYISDEELLERFPEGSCYIGEVNGRKILVFKTQELQEKYLYQ